MRISLTLDEALTLEQILDSDVDHMDEGSETRLILEGVIQKLRKLLSTMRAGDIEGAAVSRD